MQQQLRRIYFRASAIGASCHARRPNSRPPFLFVFLFVFYFQSLDRNDIARLFLTDSLVAKLFLLLWLLWLFVLFCLPDALV
jgi:hypothetical protein